MSVFVLKIIAAASMLIDHTAYCLRMGGALGGGAYTAMRSIGRMAFPIYCFLLVNGFNKTSDRVRYLSRLILFAAVSQIPFTLAFSSENYSLGGEALAAELLYSFLPYAAAAVFACAVWYFIVRRDGTVIYVALSLALAGFELTVGGFRVLGEDLNVFYTLAFSLAVLCLIDAARERKPGWEKLTLCALALAAVMYLLLGSSDYGAAGLMLVLIIFLTRRNKYLQALGMCLWCAYEYGFVMGSAPRLVCACLAALAALLYNGRLGKPAKLGFYIFYPGHLMLLALVNIAALLLAAA